MIYGFMYIETLNFIYKYLLVFFVYLYIIW